MDMTFSVLSKNYCSQKEKKKTRVIAKWNLARPDRLDTGNYVGIYNRAWVAFTLNAILNSLPGYPEQPFHKVCAVPTDIPFYTSFSYFLQNFISNASSYLEVHVCPLELPLERGIRLSTSTSALSVKHSSSNFPNKDGSLPNTLEAEPREVCLVQLCHQKTPTVEALIMLRKSM